MILVGKMGSGKSTVADFMNVKQLAFADLLKRVVKATEEKSASHGLYLLSDNGFPMAEQNNVAYIYKLLEIIHKIKPSKCGKGYARWYYQQLGQKVREINPLFWVNVVKKKLPQNTYLHMDYVITDCRFKNEFDSFMYDVSIYIECNDEERLRRLTARDGDISKDDLLDVSEIELESLKSRCDYIIDTTGLTLDELKREVKEVMDDVKESKQYTKARVKH